MYGLALPRYCYENVFRNARQAARQDEKRPPRAGRQCVPARIARAGRLGLAVRKAEDGKVCGQLAAAFNEVLHVRSPAFIIDTGQSAASMALY
jgi:hypothetical protein